eukprot:TRINITY_DN64252_c0_g1_i1.p1 TRINITY_DN64252_c0_g1~~TRINITY_DN64252_c0_g1_i1.p1  ORF type:complete len:502 (+),score=90.33 TRINITY_DN64252_c0_g1_i1:117-1622(+)
MSTAIAPPASCVTLPSGQAHDDSQCRHGDACGLALVEFGQLAEALQAVVTRVQTCFAAEHLRLSCERAALEADRAAVHVERSRIDRSVRAVEEAAAVVTAMQKDAALTPTVPTATPMPRVDLNSVPAPSPSRPPEITSNTRGVECVASTGAETSNDLSHGIGKEKVSFAETSEKSFPGHDGVDSDGQRRGSCDVDGQRGALAPAPKAVPTSADVQLEPPPAPKSTVVGSSAATTSQLPPRPGRPPPPAATAGVTSSGDGEAQVPAMRIKEPPAQKRKSASTAKASGKTGSPAVKATPEVPQQPPTPQVDDDAASFLADELAREIRAAEGWISQKLVEGPPRKAPPAQSPFWRVVQPPPQAKDLDDEIPLPPAVMLPETADADISGVISPEAQAEVSVPCKAMPSSCRVRAVPGSFALTPAPPPSVPPGATSTEPASPQSSQPGQSRIPMSRYKAPPAEFVKAASVATGERGQPSKSAIDDEACSSSSRGNKIPSSKSKPVA